MGPGFRRGRRRGLVAGAVIGSAVAGNRAAKAADNQAAEAAEPAAATSDVDQQMAQLEQLGKLKDQGILTQEEFDAKKQQILGL